MPFFRGINGIIYVLCDVEVISARFFHYKFTMFLFGLNKYLGDIIFGSANIVFLLKILNINFSIHLWILPAAMITVAF